MQLDGGDFSENGLRAGLYAFKISSKGYKGQISAGKRFLLVFHPRFGTQVLFAVVNITSRCVRFCFSLPRYLGASRNTAYGCGHVWSPPCQLG